MGSLVGEFPSVLPSALSGVVLLLLEYLDGCVCLGARGSARFIFGQVLVPDSLRLGEYSSMNGEQGAEGVIQSGPVICGFGVKELDRRGEGPLGGSVGAHGV